MNIAIFIIAAVSAYLISGLNPAIILSSLIYHEDIRKNPNGSGNPGFTNFKRCYGLKWGWLVMLLDISKAIVLELVFGWLFTLFVGDGQRLLGIAWTGLFAMVGHAYPCWYKFKGGKAFLVCVTTLFLINWKAGLFAFILLSVLLLLTHYMSLSTIVSMIAGAIVLPFLGVTIFPSILFALCAAFTTFRHKENIKHLANGDERKFYFLKNKTKKTEKEESSEDEQEQATPSEDEEKSN